MGRYKSDDPIVKLTVRLRKSQRARLKKICIDLDMNVNIFIKSLLKAKIERLERENKYVEDPKLNPPKAFTDD